MVSDVFWQLNTYTVFLRLSVSHTRMRRIGIHSNKLFEKYVRKMKKGFLQNNCL